MGKIVHRINAPFVACTVVGCMENTINDRVTHVDIWACHVDFGTQDLFAIGIFPSLHFFKKAQVFFDAAVTVRAFLAWRIEGAAIFLDFFLRQIIDIGLAQLD